MPWTKIPQYEEATASSDRVISYSEAICEGLRQALEVDPYVFVLGEGVDDPGGIFGTTKGLVDQFGKNRIMDMPLSENAMAGITIGASHAGMRPVCVHMRTDFLLLAIDQIANHASKWNYMFGGQVKTPVVFRAIIGRGWGSGAQHSQALHPVFMHFPGLRIVVPSNPLDAKGMILGAIRSNDPVLIFEHRWLYNLKGIVPEAASICSLKGAKIVHEGEDVTVVASGLSCKIALEALQRLSSHGISIEIIDLRSLKPLDITTIGNSVTKTGCLVVFDLSWEACGVGSEIISQISQHYFNSLKRHPVNIALPECPVPASPTLEKAFYPTEENLVEAILRIVR
jgi:pyruvate dehydrogenase E1 component beta subunit